MRKSIALVFIFVALSVAGLAHADVDVSHLNANLQQDIRDQTIAFETQTGLKIVQSSIRFSHGYIDQPAETKFKTTNGYSCRMWLVTVTRTWQGDSANYQTSCSSGAQKFVFAVHVIY